MVAHLIPPDQFLPGAELFWQAGSVKGREEEMPGRKEFNLEGRGARMKKGRKKEREISEEEMGK